MSSARASWRPDLEAWCWAAAIAVFACAAYATSLRGVFVYDDIAAIVDNPTLRHVSWAAVLPPPGVTTSGRPLLNLSLALNYAVGGLNVTGYHVLNIAVHALAGLALFGVVRRTLGRPRLRDRFGAVATPMAAATALLWTVHPLLIEAVTYVVQRAESLMGLFFLLTLYGFARSVDSARPRRWQVLSVVACLFGVASKEVIATAPLLVLLYDRTFVAGTFRSAWQARWRYHVALFATWIPLLLLVASTGWNRSGTVGLGVNVQWWAYGVTQFRALTHYLFLAGWPHPLVFDYGTRWEANWLAVVPYAAVILALLTATCVALRHRPVLGFLGAAFFIPLAPTSLLPGTTQMIVEHRMYLSLAPVLALLVAACCGLLGRRAVWLCVTAAVALAVATAARNRDYRSDVTLWADTVAKAPESGRAECNLAIALVQQGNVAAAVPHYRRSLALAPNASNTHYNYGLALAKLGRLQDAVAEYQAALRLAPDLVDARCNLGSALLALGRPAEALPELQRAHALRPGDTDILANLGTALAQTGRLDDAIDAFNQAVALHPDDADFRYDLGTALLTKGDRQAAIAQFEAALRLRPNDPDIQRNLNVARQR